MSAGDDDTFASSLAGRRPSHAAFDGGERIAGRYQLVRWLGGGGMGRVYAVRDRELDEEVALKVLHAGLAGDLLERFRREVRLTRKIQHRNVARMFDIGEHAGSKFLTMELIDGEPLSRALATGAPMAWERLAPIAQQICAGLAAAHALGVVHRDLKPDNILLERGTERIVITDFGIAHSEHDASMTQLGSVIGTPRYMAPEQLAGREVDRRADVFSLGVVLFELATGTRPWAGDNAIEVAVAQAIQPARPLVSDDMPRGAIATIVACLALDPAARPASAADVATALAQPGSLETRPEIAMAGTAIANAPRAVAGAMQTTLVVLPVARGPGDDYLADGVYEDLTDTLSSSPTLRVRPVGATQGLATADPRTLGAQLAVDHVVVASLRRTPTGLRIAARLIGVADGFQVWAHRVDCAETEVLAVSETIARGIATALSTRATAGDRPTDPRAVELYLHARAELRGYWGEITRAASLLEDAARIAPDSPAILAALALARTKLWAMRDGSIARVREAIARALPTGQPEAALASALYRLNTGDPVGGAADLGTALRRAPMSPSVREATARLLAELSDDTGEVRHHYATAVELDPNLAQVISADVMRLDAYAGNWPQVDARLAALVADPDPVVQSIAAAAVPRIASWRGDRYNALASAARFAPRLTVGRGRALLELMLRAAATGTIDLAAWHDVLDGGHEPDAPQRRELYYAQIAAENAMMLGFHEHAIVAIELAAAHNFVDLPWLDRCPCLAPIHDHPRVAVARATITELRARMLAAFRQASS